MRGRNGEWLRARSRRAVGEVGVLVMLEFGPQIGECGDHVSVQGEDGNRSQRGSVNGKEGVIGRELMANFFFFYVEKASDMFDHLFMGEGHFRTCWAIRRGRGDNVWGVAGTVGRRGGAGWNEDRGGSIGHHWAVKKVVEGVE